MAVLHLSFRTWAANTLAGDLDHVAHQIVGAGTQSDKITSLYTSYTSNDPQLLISIDREKAKTMNVSLDQISSTLSVFMGSEYVNDFDFHDRSYRVYVQANQQDRHDACRPAQVLRANRFGADDLAR